jgi:hypothetical protein
VKSIFYIYGLIAALFLICTFSCTQEASQKDVEKIQAKTEANINRMEKELEEDCKELKDGCFDSIIGKEVSFDKAIKKYKILYGYKIEEDGMLTLGTKVLVKKPKKKKYYEVENKGNKFYILKKDLQEKCNEKYKEYCK